MKTMRIENPVIDEWAIVGPHSIPGCLHIVDRGHPTQLSAERKLAILEGRDPDLVGRYACVSCSVEVQPGADECPSCLCRTFDGPFFGENG